ncbi:GIY-YIG nuclease family protein [Methylobacterium tarhaniae]|uniref:GIY-YIG nuclease family protein n=1 Tax=Methylobacterium tarhaniae TaxID=1187852 RepID=UPI000AE855FE|nr:GIY-YIG nuclease family protein [Methylobacterium tarhaniae]
MRLYLADGSPTGILTAEIMNWTGHALVAPRSRLGEALSRDEATRTGVYFLVGDDPEQPTKSRVYVGEGDSVIDRIKSHAKDSSKDFWSRVCIVTSKDANLTKSHVRYLEHRFVELTKSADRANLANGNEPGRKALPESDIADMEFFISQVEVILPVVGFDFLRPKGKIHAPEISNDKSKAQLGPQIDLILTSGKHGYEARAVEVDGELTVLAGSKATTKSGYAANSYAPLRDQLIKDGRLVPSADPQFLEFAADVAFMSASAAAAVIKNSNSNGRTAWRLVGTGQTLKEWQDAQLGAQG